MSFACCRGFAEEFLGTRHLALPWKKMGEQDVAGGFEPTSFLSHCHPESTSPPGKRRRSVSCARKYICPLLKKHPESLSASSLSRLSVPFGTMVWPVPISRLSVPLGTLSCLSDCLMDIIISALSQPLLWIVSLDCQLDHLAGRAEHPPSQMSQLLLWMVSLDRQLGDLAGRVEHPPSQISRFTLGIHPSGGGASALAPTLGIHPSGASALAPSFYGGSATQLELDQNGRRRFYCATSVWQGTWPVVLLAGTTPSCSLRGVGSASP